MNEEIRKIVEGYISEGDYEKALSLLMKFPLDDEQDKALLESCKKEFATSCASAIAEAAKAKNKDKAELILSSYKHLLGEDTNTILYQTIIDGIQEQKAQQLPPQQFAPQQPYTQQPYPQQPAPQQLPPQQFAPQQPYPQQPYPQQPAPQQLPPQQFAPQQPYPQQPAPQQLPPQQYAPQVPPTEQKKEPEAKQKVKKRSKSVIERILKKPALLVRHCAVGEDFGSKPILWKSYLLITAFVLFLALIGQPILTFFTIIVAIPISLGVPVCYCKNKLFRGLAIALLTTPVITFLLVVNGVVELGVLSWPSFVYAIVYFFITHGKIGKKLFWTILLFLILNPLNGVFYDFYYDNTSFIIIYSLFIIHLAVYFVSFVGVGNTLKKIKALFTKIKVFFADIKELCKENKKSCIIIASTFVALIIMFFVLAHIQNQREEEERRIAAIERARLDSIQAIENERIRAEEARKAAIEKVRQDSIREVQRREQARRDSIAEIEHAAFVKKYANIGLIVEYVTMTRGTEDGEGTKGVKIRIFNPTKKTIKYIIISVYPVDRFGTQLDYSRRCRYIGPLPSHEYGILNYDNVFPDRNDVIDDIKVSMQVVYTDGSSKSINVRNATVSSSSYEYSWFRD